MAGAIDSCRLWLERMPMFRSILFHESESDTVADGRAMPECMPDLNLDQIISSITNGRDEYNLKPFFYTALHHVEAINYRHDILRNLENPAVRGYINSFAVKMRAMRGRLAAIEKLYYRYERARWFLDAADIYCDAVICLSHDLDLADPRSSGFLAFRQYLISYLESPGFTSLLSETQKLTTDLADIRYCLHIKGNRIKVSRYGAEPDYGAEALNTFEKFKQGAVKECRFDVSSGGYMNHVEAAVLDLVARLFPDIFQSLDQYVTRHGNYLDDTIRIFDREIQFYIACLDYIAQFKPVGLNFCYPIVTNQSKELYGHETFDLALANKLIHDKDNLVTNDFYLKVPERIFVVSGPNQGGKTTFARMFGQLHYLASIGCPVPGTEARLFLFDQLFTHFEEHEDIRNLSSKLEHDLRRIRAS